MKSEITESFDSARRALTAAEMELMEATPDYDAAMISAKQAEASVVNLGHAIGIAKEENK